MPTTVGGGGGKFINYKVIFLNNILNYISLDLEGQCP